MDTLDPRLLKALAVVISEDRNQLDLVIAKGRATLAEIDRQVGKDPGFLESRPDIEKVITDVEPLIKESRRSRAILEDGLDCLLEMATVIEGTQA